MMPLSTYRMEPYRFLFAIGFFHLIWGIGLWIAFGLGWTPYPGPEHARFMVQGFLLSFSLGFLMTAIPRFSRSAQANWPEAIAAGALAILAGMSDFASLAALVFLAAFGLRRGLATSRVQKPSFFLFIQGGLLFGLAGAALKALSPATGYAFRGWLYEGMMLMWLCGIGSRILVMLLEPESEPLSKRQNLAVFAVLAAGIFLQPFGPAAARAGDLLRLAAILYLCARVWRVHDLPRGRGALAWGVWLGLLFLAAGHAVRLASPALGVHAAHLIFIGGYCTLGLMVAVRVSIAHSGDPIELERRYRRVTVAAGLIALGAVTRFSVALLRPELYVNHLTYAALTVLAAVPLWASVVLPRLRRDDPLPETGPGAVSGQALRRSSPQSA